MRFTAPQAGQPTDDPVLLALTDTQRRFKIPVELLDQLAYGTGMDIQEDARRTASGARGFRFFTGPSAIFASIAIALRRWWAWCASASLVIAIPRPSRWRRVWGWRFSSPTSFATSRKTRTWGGSIFPRKIWHVSRLRRRSCARLRFPSVCAGCWRPKPIAPANTTAPRDDLMPLIDEDSQPALWVLVTIYRRLLEKIADRKYDVFSRKISLTAREKAHHPGKGFAETPGLMTERWTQSPKVAVVGGGLAGLAAGCALAESGFRVTLFERRPYLGGRASSYQHPGTGEVVDNCQHVLLGCCTNLIEFYQRIGVEDKIRWYDRMTFLEPGGRASVIEPSALARSAAHRAGVSARRLPEPAGQAGDCGAAWRP